MSCTTTRLADYLQPADILRRAPLFGYFKEDVLQRFTAEARVLTLPKGNTLFIQEEPAEWFYYIASGWVRLFRETLDGDEVIIDVLPEGEMFGETSIFEQNTYPYSADCVAECRLFAFPTALLERTISEDPQMALSMLRHTAQKNAIKDKEIEHLTIQNAPQRIGCFLLRLIKEDMEGPITLHLPYDKTLLAARLGMKPETFSRALARLQKDIDMDVKGAAVTIPSLKKLVSYSCSACSSMFPCTD